MIRRLTPPVVIALSPLLIIPIGLAARANASPVDDYVSTEAAAICAQLDANATFAGVSRVGSYLMNIAGFTPEQAAEVVVTAVVSECPKYMPLLRAYGEQSTQRTRPISGGIGGKLP